MTPFDRRCSVGQRWLRSHSGRGHSGLPSPPHPYLTAPAADGRPWDTPELIWGPRSPKPREHPSGPSVGKAALGLDQLHLSGLLDCSSFFWVFADRGRSRAAGFLEPIWIPSCLHFTVGKPTFFTQGDALPGKNCASRVEF